MDVHIETIQRIQQLSNLQDERTHSMKIFEEAYNIYIANKSNCNLAKFRQLVNDSTKNFKRISNGFIETAQKLRADGFEHLADLIISVQTAEDDRLHLCARLQMAKQEAKNDKSGSTELWNKVAHLKELHKKSIEIVNEKMEKLCVETDKFEK